MNLKKKYGEKIGLLSAGLNVLVNDKKNKLGVKYSRCNILEIKNGDYTGNVIYFVDDNELNKGLGAIQLCEEMHVNPKNVLAVIDGKEDAPLCDVVGTSIAIKPQHKILEEKADIVLKNVKDLSMLIRYL